MPSLPCTEVPARAVCTVRLHLGHLLGAWLSRAWCLVTPDRPSPRAAGPWYLCFCVAADGVKSQEAPCLPVKQSEARRVHWWVGWLPNLDWMVGSWTFSSAAKAEVGGGGGAKACSSARYVKGTNAGTDTKSVRYGQIRQCAQVVFLTSRELV